MEQIITYTKDNMKDIGIPKEVIAQVIYLNISIS